MGGSRLPTLPGSNSYLSAILVSISGIGCFCQNKCSPLVVFYDAGTEMTVLCVKGVYFRCSVFIYRQFELKLEWLRAKLCLLGGVSQAEVGQDFMPVILS